MNLIQTNLETALKAYLNGDKNVHVVFNKFGNSTFMKLSDLFEDVSICFIENVQTISDVINTKDTNTKDTNTVDDTVEQQNSNKHDKVSIELTKEGKAWVPPSLTNAEEERRKVQSRKLKIDLGKMFALKQAGWSRAQVADDLNVSYQTVSKYWNKEKEYLAGEL